MTQTRIVKTILVYVLTFELLANVHALQAQGHGGDNAAIIRYDSIHHPVIGTEGMVSSQRELSSQIGANILSRGGNAVDAAVATGIALAVTLPRAGNLGGGGFMLVYLAKHDKTIAIDYREMTPAAAHRDIFLNKDGSVDNRKVKFSHLSSGVPGTVAGLAHALEKYGTMSWEEVVTPAIELAEKGILVSYDLSYNLKSRRSLLIGNEAAAKAYYKKGGVPYDAGEVLVQPDLAKTLKRLAKYGPDEFYKGKTAELIASEMKKNGGLITMDDLANYKVAERPVITTNYRGYDIVSMPLTSSGGIHIAQMLNILENHPVKEHGFGSAKNLHLLSETMKLAYADRSEYLGDPDHFKVPVVGLTSKAYAKSLSQKISMSKATPSNKVNPGNPAPYESPDTTHFSVMDKHGNAVSNTYTLNFSYGSGIVIPGTGILMNNEMDDFSFKPGVPNAFGLVGGEANDIAPKKRPLSSMAPTMVFKDGKPYIVIGSPGGSRIITTLLQVIINVIDHDMNIAEAVHAPRIHHQWLPDRLQLEPGFSPDTMSLLKEMGQNVEYSKTMGSVQTIMYEGGYFYGVSDPRRPGAGTVAAEQADAVIKNRER